jgi:DNA polymerase II
VSLPFAAPQTLDGFILTRQSQDRRQPHAAEREEHNEIVLWLASAQGPVRVVYARESVQFLLPRSRQEDALQLFREHGIRGRLRHMELQTFAGEPVLACCFTTLARCYRAQELLLLHGIPVFEADIRHAERILMDRFITASVQVTGTVTAHRGYLQIQADVLAPSEERPAFSVLSLDVECAMSGQLYSVGLQGQRRDGSTLEQVIMVGDPREHQESFTIHWVADEKQLLLALTPFFQQFDPDIIIGWNVVNFDFQLLIQRAELHHLSLRWGRAGEPVRWRAPRDERQLGQVIFPGRVVLDGIATLKSATWQFDSFSLESVAQSLLGRGKAIEEVEERGEAITVLFQADKLALARYNLEDCRLVSEIFAHCHLLEFACLRSQLTGLELDRYGGSVAAFTHLYLPHLHRRGFVAPNMGSITGAPSPGGYVMDSRPGLYRHVLVLDYKSLYPSIIRSFGIDPLGLILGLRDKAAETAEATTSGPIPGFLGAYFSRQEPILPGLIASLWRERDKAKAQQDDALSRAIKILMNSFYGVLGSTGCRFFDPRLASSITLRGQWIMLETRRFIEATGFQVIYGDTDSTFVWLDREVSAEQAQTIGRQLAAQVTEYWQQRLQEEWGLASCLELQFERHYRRFLMPTIRGTEVGSKKRYAGLEGEGEQEQIIFKGLETVRSDWTELAKQFQRGLYQHIFHDEDPTEFIAEMVRQTRAGEVNDWLVYRKRLRRKLSDYQKNQPPHVRAARLADEARRAAGLPPRYQHRGSIAYVMTTQGAEPREYQTSPLDYEHYVQKQLRPVADAILPFIGRQFDEWAEGQLPLF